MGEEIASRAGERPMRWHYTTGEFFPAIVENMVINLSTEGNRPGERAAAWFSSNQHYDKSARGKRIETSGDRQAKGTHIGKQKGPTWGQMYTGRGQSVGYRLARLLLFHDRAVATFGPPRRNGSGLCGDATRQG